MSKRYGKYEDYHYDEYDDDDRASWRSPRREDRKITRRTRSRDEYENPETGWDEDDRCKYRILLVNLAQL